MTQLQIITDAYDKVSISYVVRAMGYGWDCLILCNPNKKAECEKADLRSLLHCHNHFMEFNENGDVVSY